MEVYRIYKALRRRAWLIVLLCLVGTASAAVFTKRERPVYAATATLMINPAAASALLPYASDAAKDLAATYAHYLKSRSFAQLVVQRTGLDLNADEVGGAISSEAIPRTQFFAITVTHASPELAQFLANTVAETFISENQSQQRQFTGDTMAQLLQVEQEQARARVEDLRLRIAQLQAAAPDSPELRRLQTELNDTLKVLLESTTALLNYRNMAGNMTTAVIIDRAVLPTTPINKTFSYRNLIFGFLGGLSVGLGLLLYLEYWESSYSVRTPEELERLLQLPSSGVINVIKGRRDEDRLVALYQSRAPVVEAYRALRTQVDVALADLAPRSLLVTSPAPREGKTLTTCNLALVLAQAGKRVVLVDADMRRPNVHRMLGIPNARGLSDLLANETIPLAPQPFGPPGRPTLDSFLRRVANDRLWVLTGGSQVANHSELLHTGRMVEVLAALSARADIVLVDAPPVMVAADAVILASLVSGVLLVVAAGQTRQDLIVRSADLLRKVGGNLIGTVLNKVRMEETGYYYYYGSGPASMPAATPPRAIAGAPRGGLDPSLFDEEWR
ncbi:MAG: polysaccharide biosynthesis tyrosine autokinase [Chloroflexi bacterium]|nr:polysaccharide biosynthesis tyrosine autokinase [Chloroflexota bacterium]